MSHRVIDNFAPPALVRALIATWLPPDSGHWHLYENGKRCTKDPSRLPLVANLLIQQIATIDDPVVRGTFPDVEYLHGAGLHDMPPGSTLGLHLDSERHPLRPWKREASAVLYLNDCDGGSLELCAADGTTQEQIECRANRLVLFATPHQWHRVTECKSPRRSLCLFFWSLADQPIGATSATFA